MSTLTFFDDLTPSAPSAGPILRGYYSASLEAEAQPGVNGKMDQIALVFTITGAHGFNSAETTASIGRTFRQWLPVPSDAYVAQDGNAKTTERNKRLMQGRILQSLIVANNYNEEGVKSQILGKSLGPIHEAIKVLANGLNGKSVNVGYEPRSMAAPRDNKTNTDRISWLTQSQWNKVESGVDVVKPQNLVGGNMNTTTASVTGGGSDLTVTPPAGGGGESVDLSALMGG